MTTRPPRTLLLWIGLSLITAVAGCIGLLPALTGLALAVVMLLVSAHLALSRPDLWLALYIAVLLVMPDPHFTVAGVSIGVNASDPLFLGALPSLILRPIRRRSVLLRIAAASLVWAGFTLVAALLFSGPLVAAVSTLRWIRLAEGLFPVFFVFQRIGDTERSLRLCEPVFFGAAVFASAFGIAQFFLGFDLSFLGIQYTSTQLLWLGASPRQRAVGLFYESSGFGTLAGLLVFLSLFLLVSSRSVLLRRRVALLFLALAVGTVALLLSFTRSAVVGLAGGLLIGGLFGGGSLAKRASAVFCTTGILFVIGMIVAALAPQWALAFVNLRLLPAVSLWGSYSWDKLAAITSGRTQTWSVLLQAFWDAGPFYRVSGIGYKSLPFSPFATSADWTLVLSGDNQFITTLVEQGIIGLTLFLTFNAVLLIELWRVGHDPTTLRGQWARVLAIYWSAQTLFVFPVLDYFAIFRLLPVLFSFFALVVADAGSTTARSSQPQAA